MEGDMTRTTVYISAEVLERARENGLKKGMLSEFVTACVQAVGDGDHVSKISPDPIIKVIRKWKADHKGGE